MTEFYNIIDVDVKNAIESVMNEVDFNDIIDKLENITTEANKYIFRIYNVSLEIETQLKTFKKAYDDLDDNNLEKFKERCDNKENFKSYLDGKCDYNCKNAIKLYFEKYDNNTHNNYTHLLTSIELLKTSTNFTQVSYPYSTYKVFVKEYSNIINTTTDSDKQSQIISFFILIFIYLVYS